MAEEEESVDADTSAEEEESVDAEASGENGDAESDLDSLMSEVGANESVEESTTPAGDLSSLVTEAGDKEEQDLDSMLESTEPVPLSADDEEQSMNVEFLLEMPLTVTFEVGRAKMDRPPGQRFNRPKGWTCLRETPKGLDCPKGWTFRGFTRILKRADEFTILGR